MESKGILIASVVCLCTAGFLYLGVPWIHGRCLRLLLKWKATKTKAVVLTFDDGPGTRLTPALLSVLAEYDAKATFFLLGENIRGREAIVQQIIAAGHEICSHGYKHMHYWKVPPFQSLADIKKGWQAINTVLGVKRSKYPFRPPHGKINIICLFYLWMRRVPIVYWTIDVGDTWSPDERDGQKMVLQVKKAGGAVTLAHDFDRSDDSNDCFVLESIKSVLTMAQQSDLQMLTVSQLMENKR